MTKTIGLYISGLPSEKHAQAELEDAEDWFKTTFDQDRFSVQTSITQGPYGWRMEFNAIEEASEET